jgi:uncharacterized protein YuzE
MKLYYYADTDSLYIDLAERPSVTSEEVRPGIVLDLDNEGGVVGIDIDNASSRLDLPIAGSGSIPFEAVSGSAG